ncbi:MAG: hypothetical protein KC478_16225 [Bacteriovoracaceae bacterium]|nr:hypothetical protein [Bacteriovoracaceae bacterium]
MFILVLLFNFSGPMAQDSCAVYFLNSSAHIELYASKNTSWFSRIKKLELNEDFIDSLSELPQQIKGRVSPGIFRAFTQEGNYVLKFIPGHQYLDHYAHKILLQKHLSEFGLAPKVRGVYARAHLAQLKSKFSQIEPRSNIGILMEEVEGAMIKQAYISNGALPDLTKLPLSPEFNEKVRGNIHSLQKALNDLEVSVEDAQMIITQSGEVKLIDFDFYEWDPDEILRERRIQANFKNILELFP